MSYVDKLSTTQLKKFRTICRSEANFLSGTVSPAKADKETMNIESLTHALEHYAKRGVEKVIIQPKYMGSRCQVYVNKDINKCYAITRNGYRVNTDNIDLSEVFKERHEFWFGNGTNPQVELVIEDGELMPWSTLGKGLIYESFYGFYNMATSELNTLERLGFHKSLLQTTDRILRDENAKPHEVKTFEHAQGRLLPDEERELLSLFKEQVDLYGQEGKVEFKPFNILKIVRENGSESVCMDYNEENYRKVSKDLYFIVNPSEGITETLSEYMEHIENQRLEGVVVKPCIFESKPTREERYAPYIKVRNPEYLRITYGYDYTQQEKLEKLIDKKSIGGKIGQSIKDYEIGKDLLKIPYVALNSKNDNYRELVAAAILSMDKAEKNLDPRL